MLPRVRAEVDDSIDGLLERFFRKFRGHTLRAYRQDLEDFARWLAPALPRGLFDGQAAGDGPAAEGQLPPPLAEAAAMLLSGGHGRANDLVLGWRADMIDRKLSAGTINRRLATVRGLVRRARVAGRVAWELEVEGVTRLVLRDTRGPGAQAAGAMLAAAAATAEECPVRAARDHAMLQLLVALGLRRGEICSLDVQDADLAGQRLWVRRKGKTEKQSLSMPPAAVRLVKAWLAHRPHVPAANGTPALFVNFDRAAADRRLTGAGLYSIVRAYGRLAGVTARPHGLRHTAITEAIKAGTAAGASLDEIRQFSGHKHIATLLLYRDAERNLQGQLAAAVSRAIRPRRTHGRNTIRVPRRAAPPRS